MTSYEVALFIHILGVVILAGATAMEWTCLRLVRRTRTGNDLKNTVAIARGLEAVFPLSGLAILASGVYMVEKVWSWGDAWVLVALGAFIVQSIVGALVTSARIKALSKAAAAAAPGALTPEVQAKTQDPVLWGAEQLLVTLLVAIVFMMVAKPELAGALASVAIAAGVAAGWSVLTMALGGGGLPTDETQAPATSR